MGWWIIAIVAGGRVGHGGGCFYFYFILDSVCAVRAAQPLLLHPTLPPQQHPCGPDPGPRPRPHWAHARPACYRASRRLRVYRLPLVQEAASIVFTLPLGPVQVLVHGRPRATAKPHVRMPLALSGQRPRASPVWLPARATVRVRCGMLCCTSWLCSADTRAGPSRPRSCLCRTHRWCARRPARTLMASGPRIPPSHAAGTPVLDSAYLWHHRPGLPEFRIRQRSFSPGPPQPLPATVGRDRVGWGVRVTRVAYLPTPPQSVDRFPTAPTLPPLASV